MEATENIKEEPLDNLNIEEAKESKENDDFFEEQRIPHLEKQIAAMEKEQKEVESKRPKPIQMQKLESLDIETQYYEYSKFQLL